MNPKFDHIRLCVYYQSYIMQSLMFLACFVQKLSARPPPPPPPPPTRLVNGHQAFESMSLLGALIFILKQHIHYRNNH